MAKTKKITVYSFSIVLTISLLAGYFCFMPQMAKAASMTMPDMSFSDCQEMPVFSPYMLSSATPAHAIAPCCLEKNNHNSQSGAINLDNFSFDNIECQSIFGAQIVNNNSIDYAVLFDYPISPTQTELLSSVIIRD